MSVSALRWWWWLENNPFVFIVRCSPLLSLSSPSCKGKDNYLFRQYVSNISRASRSMVPHPQFKNGYEMIRKCRITSTKTAVEQCVEAANTVWQKKSHDVKNLNFLIMMIGVFLKIVLSRPRTRVPKQSLGHNFWTSVLFLLASLDSLCPQNPTDGWYSLRHYKELHPLPRNLKSYP